MKNLLKNTLFYHIMEERIGSGSEITDRLLGGGYEKGIITCIYGPAGSGKTNLLLLCIANSPHIKDKKIIFIDTEGNFSAERMKQITDDYESIMKRIILIKHYTFEEQRRLFEKLSSFINEKIGLLILDSATMLYRLEFSNVEDISILNRELGNQLSYLAKIAYEKNIPVIITGQVYSDFEQEGKVRLVGGNILKYSSKCIIELEKKKGPLRRAILIKHRSLPEKEILFKITDKGIEEIK